MRRAGNLFPGEPFGAEAALTPEGQLVRAGNGFNALNTGLPLLLSSTRSETGAARQALSTPGDIAGSGDAARRGSRSVVLRLDAGGRSRALRAPARSAAAATRAVLRRQL